MMFARHLSWGFRGLCIASLAVAAACGGQDDSPAVEEAKGVPRAPEAPAPPPAAAPAPAGSGAAAPARRPAYLALGDSIAFGYNLDYRTYLPDGTTKNLPDQADHAVGYPEALAKIVARDSKVQIGVANTSCPGEASGSMVTGRHLDDNDCWENRHAFKLHYEYAHKDYDNRDGTPLKKDDYGAGTSQLAHALAFLGDDPNGVKLVTITAGANDATKFTGGACNWAQSLGDKACLAGGALDAVLNKVQGNWETILTALVAAGYRGPIVAVLYYSPGYQLTDLPTRAGIKILNAKIHDGVKAVLAKYPMLNLKFVESYDVFEGAAGSAGGDACKAGLLVPLTQGPSKGTCDVHASNHGEELLADAVWRSLDFAEQQALLATGTSVP
jgi:lysophospholipase L1-like esterase